MSHHHSLSAVRPYAAQFLSYLLNFSTCVYRSEEGGQHLPHAEAPPHCGAAGDVQFRRDALHGFRVVSLGLAKMLLNVLEHTNLTITHKDERKRSFLMGVIVTVGCVDRRV